MILFSASPGLFAQWFILIPDCHFSMFQAYGGNALYVLSKALRLQEDKPRIAKHDGGLRASVIIT